MKLRTVTIATVRAEDIPEGATVRTLTGPHTSWQWVYSATIGGRKSSDDGDGNVATIAAKLDERYVVLRLSDDRALSLPQTREAGITRFKLDRFTGSPAEYDDQYVVARATDLWEIQILRSVTVDPLSRAVGA